MSPATGSVLSETGGYIKQINLKAMAKINLGLDVVRRREDGYHDLRMIMQTVRLFDRIRLSVTRSGGVRLKTNLGFLPTDASNHACKAAQMLIDEFGIKDGVFIDLEKHIPVAAGLAGGSSDAAAVLVGMNLLFGLGLSSEQLRLRGVKIGADVPYCIMRGTALAEGIGDTVRVSLTADPLKEPAAAREILSALGLGGPRINVVSCPTCGRTRIDLIPLLERLERAIDEEDLRSVPVTVALMGCAVNGPGEAREADVGAAGGDGDALLFRHGETCGKIPQEEIVPRLIAEIKALRDKR